MLTALVMACVAQGSVAWQPRTQATGFELALPASAEQMRQAFTRPRGTQQLVWLPGVLQAPAQDVTLGQGPVRRLQVIPKKRGTIVLLTGRDAAALGPQTALVGSPALLRVGPPLQAHHAATDATSATSATDATAGAYFDDAPRPWAQGGGMRPTTWVMWGAGCTFLLAIAYLARQRIKPHEHGSIEIVSVRSLGPRHKLALVTAGGERLLLATTDKEVILLSHLGPADPDPDLESEAASHAPSAIPEFKVPTRPAPSRAPAKRPAASIPVRAPTASYAPDVMGLLRLKRPAVQA